MDNSAKQSPEILRTWTLGERGKHRRAMCRCVCGKEFETDLYKVKTGHTKSCGCLSRRGASERFSTHRMKGTREYSIWCGIKARCTNPRSGSYRNYGGRGIKICDAWVSSFEQFLADMGPCPDGLSIERRDSDGDYEPSNCVWASNAEQSRNKRNNRVVEYDGRQVLIKDLAKEIGIGYHTLRYRIIKLGLSVDQAINFKKHHYARKQNFGEQHEK